MHNERILTQERRAMKTLRIPVLLAAVLLCAAVLLLVAGCKEDPPESLFDPAYVSKAQPVITSYTTLRPNLAGVTVFTFAGSNFSANADEDIVFFDGTRASVLSASATQLRVLAPYIVKDTVIIKVAVKGATMFTDPIPYKLEAPTKDFGQWKTADEAYGIAYGPDDTLYASLLSGGVGIGVKKIRGDGTRRDYSPAFSSAVNLWTSMKFGPGGLLYTVARNFIFRIPAGGNAAAVRWATISGASRIVDIDFDANNNLWACGTGNTNIYRIRTSDANVKAFACAGDMRAVRVYAGYVYVGGLRGTDEKVFRFPIVTADSLGSEQEYFNLTSVYGSSGGGIQAMTFNTDGDLYIGTDNAEGIRIVHADKTSEAMYPGIMLPKNISFAWGSGSSLYVSRTGGVLPSGSVTNALMWVNTQKTGAPTYGR
jgi:hypothetical protein